jgi:hypothetical protein
MGGRNGNREVSAMVVGVLIGLVIGVAVGLAAGPWLRSWISWREYVQASREARLHDEILRLMSSADDRTRPTAGR